MILNLKLFHQTLSRFSRQTGWIKFICTGIALLQHVFAFASIIVAGNSTTTPFGFTSPIVVKAYDRHTGTMYVGIENQTNEPSNSFSLAKATRPNPSAIAQFVGIGFNSILQNQTLEELVIMPPQDDASIGSFNPPLLAMLILNGERFLQTQITVSTNDGNSVLNSGTLNDANGAATSGIVEISANSCFVATAVRSDDGSQFGINNSGINVVSVTETPLTLRTIDANTGLPGNKAVLFNDTITQLKGDSGGSDVTISTDADDINQVSMYYDQIFDRFYIGVRISTGANANDIGKAVVVSQILPCEGNELELFPIVADDALDPLADQIIVAQGANINIRALELRVMHCSTGPDYLIVNGGIGTTAQVGDFIFAMPLVNLPDNETLHGTLANANSELSPDCNHVFIVPATGTDQLLTQNDVRALVGAGPVPILPNQAISDMVVTGDAVYISIDIAPDCAEQAEESNDTGVFYSQALFDETGKIARWSPWKRATPFNAFPGVKLAGCMSHDGQVKFFDVDAKTGSMWIVEGTTDLFVGYLNWGKGACEIGLIQEVSELLCNGVYSVLDLNQQTPGFTSTPNRYALFGGVDKVVFTRVSIACNPQNPLSPETPIFSFECDKNIFIDELPDFKKGECSIGAGCVTSLAYSKRTAQEGNQNYFFAGTETGLYAFSVTNTTIHQGGFNVDQLNELDQPPFIQGSWSRITEIDGAVLDIKTSGSRLYVLTMNHSCEQPFINTLYSIGYADTLEEMFGIPANIEIIAQNRVGAFENTCAFFDMAIISTGAVNDDVAAPLKEQLILATSNGLFKSNANQNPGNGIIDATNQTEALWELIDGTAGIAFDGIGTIDVPIEHTVWPFSIADARNFKTFDRSKIHQESGTGNIDGTQAEIGTYEPLDFNACSCFKKFKTLSPITYFWTDGERRFFIINRTMNGSLGTQIAVSPFDVTNWNVQQFEPLYNPFLQQFKQINFVRNIGATGLVVAGTNRGLIGLE